MISGSRVHEPIRPDAPCMAYLPARLGHFWGFYVAKYAMHGASGLSREVEVLLRRGADPLLSAPWIGSCTRDMFQSLWVNTYWILLVKNIGIWWYLCVFLQGHMDSVIN